jgi:16S rRNA (guanine527-N7)-methyltransferase
MRLLDRPVQLVDLGSGAGFPGLVLAILSHEEPFPVHLIESNNGKAAFLREAARTAGVSVQIHARRAEDVVGELSGKGSIVTARALAPLPDLLEMAEPLLKTGAGGLFLKGREARRELTEADKSWRLDAELVPSITDPTAYIVRVRSADRRTTDA